MILTNKLMEQKVVDQKILEKLLILLSPFAPHLAEELWEKSGHKKSIIIEKWPVADELKLRSETVEFAVQVNGKLRAKISLSPDVSEAEAVAAAKELDNVKKYLSGQEIKKTIFVPGRMISFVV
jgi:leucyl-tRNA synthetase